MSWISTRWKALSQLLRFRRPQISAAKRRLAAVADVDDLRLLARRRVPRAVFDYTDGGAGREISMNRSREAYARVEFSPRVLHDVAKVDTSTSILGRPAALPLVFGPTGFTRMMHHAGEPAVARAAGRLGVPYVLSTMGTTPLERLADEAPDTRRWYQLYLWRDREASADMVRRAEASGCDTLMLTVDTPVGGPRLRDIRNGMTIPPELTLRTMADFARRPRWWSNLLIREPLEFATLTHFSGTVSQLASIVFDPSVGYEELAWLRSNWSGSLVVKGVQGHIDARAVVDAGADAIVLSNHGGRQLDRAPTPLEQLGAVVAEIGDEAEVYVDGGVMSGGDVAAAVALGARGAFIGRAYLYGLMAGGEIGVDRMGELMRDELVNTMQLLGVSNIEQLRAQGARLRTP